MTAKWDLRKQARRFRPFRRIRKAAVGWRHSVGLRLDLLRKRADRGYIICATSRSGSSYLCQLLASTGVLGNPLEYFNTSGRRRRTDPRYPADPRVQVDVIRTRGATSNGVYGVKIIGPQLRSIGDRVDPFRDLPKLALIRLQRRDLLAQAVSLARARQTKQFLATDRQRTEPVYSTEFILHCLQSVHKQESIWDAVMARLGVQPLTVTYEEILRDPQDAVDRIAALMGLALPVPADRSVITIRMQRDDVSIEWRERFLAETGNEFRHLADPARPPSSPGSASES